jgi:uncharacterized membrane protein YhdT
MADLHRRPSRGTSRALWILVLVLLTPAVVVPLLVPLYDQTDPTLFGFPFYYWFQFALVLGAAVLTGLAYLVSTKADALAREERRQRRAGR